MEQLRAAIERLTSDVEKTLDRLDELHHVLAVERWWRRVLVGFVACVLVTVGVWFSWDRQEACDRGNRSRESVREGHVLAWSTAWDTLVEEPNPEAKARLLEAIEAEQRENYPPRDCSWPV